MKTFTNENPTFSQYSCYLDTNMKSYPNMQKICTIGNMLKYAKMNTIKDAT